MRNDDLQTLEDIRLWIADHDAKINLLWKQQHDFNERLDSRVSVIEKKIVWLTTLAAAGGGVGGQFLAALFGG